MFDPSIQPQYLDADGKVLLPGTLAVDLSDSGFGRIWSIQNLDNVLLCSAFNRTPKFLNRGKNNYLRGFAMPQVKGFNFPAWHAEFLKIGLWIWLEESDLDGILLTAVWDKDRVFESKLAEKSEEIDLKRLNNWLAECLELIRKQLVSDMPTTQKRVY